MSEALDKLIEAVEADCTNWYGWADREAALPDGLWEVARAAEHGSLSAVKALHEALVPGYFVDFRWWTSMNGGAIVTVGNRYEGRSSDPARAWLIAILRAYRQHREA